MTTRKLLTLVCFLVWGVMQGSLPSRAAVGVGEEATNFVAATRDGASFNLSTLRGKVVLINFWTSWCKPCHDELPVIEALWRKYRTQGLAVLTVNADNATTRKQGIRVAKYFTFPVAMIGAVSKNDLLTLSSVPVTYVIGKDGVVRDILQPPQRPFEPAALDFQIKTLLDEKLTAKKPEEDKKDTHLPDAGKEEKKETAV